MDRDKLQVYPAFLLLCFSTTPTYGVKVVGGLVQECVERLQDLEAVLAGRGGAEGEGAGEEVVLHVDHEEGGAFCNKIGVCMHGIVDENT